MKHAFFLLIDQLAGHWANGVEAAQGIPPANVWGYHKLGLIPNFSRLIQNGIFAFAWNEEVCGSAQGHKYLATGRYHSEPFREVGYYACRPENYGPMGILEVAKHFDPESISTAAFGSDFWVAPGYFYSPEWTVALCGWIFDQWRYDERIWRDVVLPYLR